MSILSIAMSETIRHLNYEVESQTHGQITVIFDKHNNKKGLDEGQPMWSPAVYEAVAKLKPFVMAPDSLQPGFTSKGIMQMIPVNDLSLLEPGTHVVGADRARLWPTTDDPKVNQDDWEKIMEAVIKFDSDYDPSAEIGSIDAMIRQQYAVEESVVSAGLAALTTRILWRVYKSRKENPQTHQFSRRDFLKWAGGIVAGAAVTAANYGRQPVLFTTLTKTQVTNGAPTIDQTLVRATRPIFYTDPAVDMRNAGLGVSVMSKFNHPGWSGKSAAIILGNAHGIGEYPGQKSGETLKQAIDRLLDVMRRGFKEIVINNQARENIVPPDVMAAALTEIFATRDTYLPMRDPNSKLSERKWVNFYSDLVPEVVKLITEIYP